MITRDQKKIPYSHQISAPVNFRSFQFSSLQLMIDRNLIEIRYTTPPHTNFVFIQKSLQDGLSCKSRRRKTGCHANAVVARRAVMQTPSSQDGLSCKRRRRKTGCHANAFVATRTVMQTPSLQHGLSCKRSLNGMGVYLKNIPPVTYLGMSTWVDRQTYRHAYDVISSCVMGDMIFM